MDAIAYLLKNDILTLETLVSLCAYIMLKVVFGC